ncbi:MAG: hypothetical protein QOJ71_708 [Actinomycetota bacterium]|nr:hypothetical protein [Actinomycetota bacterium]
MFASLLDEIAAERRALDAAEAAWLNKVRAYDRSGAWRADGFQNAAVALRNACHMAQGVARGHVDLARKLEQLPKVASAFAAGDISTRHATVITNAYTPKRAWELATMEAELVEAAGSISPPDLGNLVRYITDAIDGDGGADTDADQRERSGCYLSRTTDGMLDIRGLCDPLTGDIIETAVNAQMARDLQANDPRTTPQRRMDAIATLMRLPLDRGELGESHGIRPHISLVHDIRDLPGTTPDLLATIRGERLGHGRISETMLEMLLCDCSFSRILMNGESEVLDVGRAARNPTTAQWRALVARDKHCTAPGCTRPPSQCVAHHDEHWTRGGPTDLANLRLLCWYDHSEQHIADAQARARGG